MSVNLYPYQVAASAWLRGTEVALFHGDMGIGKTFIAADAARNAGAVLVLAPAVAVGNWVREIGKIDPKRRVQALRKGSDTVLDFTETVVISYDLMVKDKMHAQLARKTWDVVICDEAHYLKSCGSIRTKAFWGAGTYRKRHIAERAAQIWLLTGTPTPNNVTELYPLLRYGLPHLIAEDGAVLTFAQFTETYTKGYQTDYGWKITGNNSEAVARLQAKLAPHYLRIAKEEVLKDLPPMRIETVVVDGGAAAKQVRELGESYRAEVEAVLEGGAFGEHVATLARLTEMAKAPAAAELAREIVAGGKRVVVFARHRDVIAYLLEALADLGAVTVHGGVDHGKRDSAIVAFTEGDAQVFVGQVQAAGTAITLHGGGKCQDAIFVSADWVPSTNAQCAARIHRVGQPGSVLVRFLALEDSIDTQIAETLALKTRMIEEVFNG